MAEIPDWFLEYKRPVIERVASFNPMPFDQPMDTDGYISCHHNDYLRLSAHPEVVAAKNEATTKTGSGVMASLVYGAEHGYHMDLKAKVARAARTSDPDTVILTTCGWTANVGLMEAIVGPGVPVYIDVNAHASLWDGVRMCHGKLIPFRHNRTDLARRLLKRYGAGIIVIDGYYSTHGSVAPLIEFVEMAEESGSLLVLDEAHSFGMTGPNGGGLADETDLADRVHFRTVSFAKALGGNGGCIISDKETAHFLTFRLRSLIFSSSPPPSTSAGNLTALEIVTREPGRAQRVQENAALLRKLFNDNDIDTGPGACQIVSLWFKDEPTVNKLYGRLRDRGILFSVFLSPAVPRNVGLARFSIYYGLSRKDIEFIAENTIDAMGELDAVSKFPQKL